TERDVDGFHGVLKERALRAAAPPRDAEVFEATLGADASTLCPVKKTQLHQVRLVDLFDGALLFIDGRGNGAQSNRSAAVFFEHCQHDLLVDFVEAEAVYFQQIQRLIGYVEIHVPVGTHLRVITDAAQQAIGDARSAAAAAGDFF